MAIYDIGCLAELQLDSFCSFTKLRSLNLLSELEIESYSELKLSVKVLQAFALTKNKIRIIFDSLMKNDEQLIAPENYIIETTSSSGVQLYYDEVVPENVTYPNYVTVVCSEMTGDVLYQVTVLYGPTSKDDSPIDPNNNSLTLLGKGENPTLFRLESISKNRVDVVFSEPMFDNEAIRNKLNYSFDNGLIIMEILEVEGDRVKLVTTDQDPGVLYTLTIS